MNRSRAYRVECEYQKFLWQQPYARDTFATAGVLPYRIVPSGEVFVGLSFRHNTPRLRGLWGATGGWVETDELIMDAALRELKEEAGLMVDASRLELLGFFPGATDEERPRRFLTAQFAVHLEAGEHLSQPEPEKHGEWKPFSVEEALKLPLLPGFANCIRALAAHLERKTT